MSDIEKWELKITFPTGKTKWLVFEGNNDFIQQQIRYYKAICCEVESKYLGEFDYAFVY